jgi:hypothetical protein
LAAVIGGNAPDALLDSYESERIGFARRLVATTDRVFSFATAEGRIADLLRTRIAPVLLPFATHFEAVREFMFRTVSQVMLNYRDGPLSRGVAGLVHGGDRLPWVALDGVDNFKPLARMEWQVHVYGTADDELATWCRAHNLPLRVFAWHEGHQAAGLARDGLYLIRPDNYVALAEARGTSAALDRYFADYRIRPALVGNRAAQ